MSGFTIDNIVAIVDIIKYVLIDTSKYNGREVMQNINIYPMGLYFLLEPHF
jgi:hypothetical protein